MPQPVLRFSFVLLVVLSTAGAHAQSSKRAGAGVTATEDRDQMMAQLGVSFPELPAKQDDPNKPANAWPADASNPEGNWTDANGNVITRSSFGLWVTYDDDDPGGYTPIDLLKMDDGTPIKTASDWRDKKRPEIFNHVQEELYGYIPDPELWPAITWTTRTTVGGDKGNSFIDQELTGVIDTSGFPEVRDEPRIVARLRLPANAEKPVPVIILIGTRGFDEIWEMVAPEGWGLCSFDNNQLQPDNGAGLTSFLIGLINKGEWRKPNDWGSLAATAWGIGRLLDQFELNENVDATKVGVTGHSRWGKAATVAMAYETRLAICYPSCGGALGPSMIRRHWGQNLENLSWDREYHWCAGNLFNWMGPLNDNAYMPRKVEKLRVDAHSVIALAAPRPVFLNGGTTDTWSDAPGTYLTALAASPVYELLGAKGVVMNDDSPIPDTAYIEGDIGYRVHDGGHTPIPDWPAFIEFARRYLNGPSP